MTRLSASKLALWAQCLLLLSRLSLATPVRLDQHEDLHPALVERADPPPIDPGQPPQGTPSPAQQPPVAGSAPSGLPLAGQPPELAAGAVQPTVGAGVAWEQPAAGPSGSGAGPSGSGAGPSGAGAGPSSSGAGPSGPGIDPSEMASQLASLLANPIGRVNPAVLAAVLAEFLNRPEVKMALSTVPGVQFSNDDYLQSQGPPKRPRVGESPWENAGPSSSGPSNAGPYLGELVDLWGQNRPGAALPESPFARRPPVLNPGPPVQRAPWAQNLPPLRPLRALRQGDFAGLPQLRPNRGPFLGPLDSLQPPASPEHAPDLPVMPSMQGVPSGLQPADWQGTQSGQSPPTEEVPPAAQGSGGQPVAGQPATGQPLDAQIPPAAQMSPTVSPTGQPLTEQQQPPPDQQPPASA
ncbi:MAG: hypothetical protein M1833_004941 [Piccolia ochrophora]|nr:MAG: hypothetical protein M1833_004941 [Piccolia ochrophora]